MSFSNFERFLEMNGISLRFFINNFVDLKPISKKKSAFECTFTGKCPVTGKKDGIIVNEDKNTLELVHINKTFSGDRLERDFTRFLFQNNVYSRKWEIEDINEAKNIKRLNEWLFSLGKELMTTLSS